MPLVNILFWAFFASYVMHILDETLINGGLVQWIKDNFWPTYRVRMFFWFNAAFLAAIAAGNVLFDTFGGTKRTSPQSQPMSAFGGKAHIARTLRNVRF